jgi:hypothetical protein
MVELEPALETPVVEEKKEFLIFILIQEWAVK